MAVPYTFGNAASTLPLSQLDANFGTPITIGATTFFLGDAVTTVDQVILSNVTITSALVPTPASAGGTGLGDPGATGNVLTSDGITWTSQTPTIVQNNRGSQLYLFNYYGGF